MLNSLATDDVLLMMSDQAHFHLDGYVNKRNCRQQPKRLAPQTTAHCKSDCMVWSFQGGNCYVTMLRKFDTLGINIAEMWFKQDAATANDSMTVVREMFPQHVSRFGDIGWPARSLDLSVCDFLWGYLKSTA
ncbi:hypothetical protein Trydic_g3168 [Trypoxylus dichotomus]